MIKRTSIMKRRYTRIQGPQRPAGKRKREREIVGDVTVGGWTDRRSMDGEGGREREKERGSHIYIYIYVQREREI